MKIACALILTDGAACQVRAQRLGPEMPRPKIAAADTNDCQAYFDYGVDVFESGPKAAATAFYWAARINPGSADALYGRQAALLMSNESLRKLYIEGGRRARDSKQLRAIDSLYMRALDLNPMLYRRLDRRLITAHITNETLRQARIYGDNNTGRAEIDYTVELWLRNAGPEYRGWLNCGAGRFNEALKNYADAEKATKFKAGIRIDRGRIFRMTGQLDSAVAQFQAALTEMRSATRKTSSTSTTRGRSSSTRSARCSSRRAISRGRVRHTGERCRRTSRSIRLTSVLACWR
jgi:tetratricopeptide (TPR) repeat protein